MNFCPRSRLRGITRSIARFPTFKRRFASVVDAVFEDIIEKNDIFKPKITNSQSAIGRVVSQISFRIKTGSDEIHHQESNVAERDVEIELT